MAQKSINKTWPGLCSIDLSSWLYMSTTSVMGMNGPPVAGLTSILNLYEAGETSFNAPSFNALLRFFTFSALLEDTSPEIRRSELASHSPPSFKLKTTS